ncbi:hypothetical protein SAMN04488583_3214 [Mycobacterium sp. 88mf]|nr:hypothetical protein SAMN04488583_3214 [Mycobacterium sp. 88mf]SFF64001.1 hypothetical protein SAMN04488582_103486 [Mycobacterium sp. 455mf]
MLRFAGIGPSPHGMAALPEGKAAIMSQAVAYDSGGNWPSGITQ